MRPVGHGPDNHYPHTGRRTVNVAYWVGLCHRHRLSLEDVLNTFHPDGQEGNHSIGYLPAKMWLALVNGTYLDRPDKTFIVSHLQVVYREDIEQFTGREIIGRHVTQGPDYPIGTRRATILYQVMADGRTQEMLFSLTMSTGQEARIQIIVEPLGQRACLIFV